MLAAADGRDQEFVANGKPAKQRQLLSKEILVGAIKLLADSINMQLGSLPRDGDAHEVHEVIIDTLEFARNLLCTLIHKPAELVKTTKVPEWAARK